MATADASRPAKTLPARSDVATGDTWDLTSLFACDADWEAALAAWEARIPEFDAFTGTLGSSPERLAEAVGRVLGVDADQQIQWFGELADHIGGNFASRSAEALLDLTGA